MKNRNFVVVDLETTGLTPKTDRILEIGAVKVIDGRITDRMETFVNPGRKIPDRITKLTGITDVMVQDAPPREEAVRGFVSFSEGLPLLGHNILFDYSFLKHCAVNIGVPFEREALDTLKIARKALPELPSRSLEALCGYYEIPREHAHRAMDDVLETFALYCKMEDIFCGEHPEWFRPEPLKVKAKREGPVTAKQMQYLRNLAELHHLTLDVEVESLTKNEASRLIDQIIFRYGRQKEFRNYLECQEKKEVNRR